MNDLRERLCPKCGKKRYLFDDENECSVCRQERQLKEREAQIKEELASGDIQACHVEKAIFCPWCGTRYELSEGETLQTLRFMDMSCKECGQSFQLSVSAFTRFTTVRKEENCE